MRKKLLTAIAVTLVTSACTPQITVVSKPPLSTERSYAQSTTRIAVIDLTVKTGNIAEGEASVVTTELRNKLHDTGFFTVIERSQMAVILEEQGLQQTECFDQSCAVELGMLLGAEAVVIGSISKLDDLFLLQIRLVDVSTGAVVGTSSRSCQCGLGEVALRLVREGATQLAAAIAERNKPSSASRESGTGALLVESYPAGAQVFLDGVPQDGETPLLLRNISSGSHRISVEMEWLAGSMDVQVQPSITTPVLVSLEHKQGTLIVSTTPPQADVYIAGRLRGRTPQRLTSMDAGETRVELRLNGYQTAYRDVLVQPGVENTVSETLRPETGSLRITTTPSRAQIYISGYRLGVTPLSVSPVKIGTTRIELRLEGHRTAYRNALVKPGVETTIHERLERISRAATPSVIAPRTRTQRPVERSSVAVRKRPVKILMLIGGATIGAGIYFNQKAKASNNKQREAYRRYSTATNTTDALYYYGQLEPSANNSADIRNVLYIAGSSAIAIGIVLWSF
jgi:curli biogenesis system outer membrane secretion channel CsgG